MSEGNKILYAPDGVTPLEAAIKIKKARESNARALSELRHIKNTLKEFLEVFGSAETTTDPHATRRNWEWRNAEKMNELHTKLRTLIEYRGRKRWED